MIKVGAFLSNVHKIFVSGIIGWNGRSEIRKTAHFDYWVASLYFSEEYILENL
ncbi:hypothetical protein EMIT079MI2_150110 [Bacillus sp. IT-79MI2]|nr:hypothetical protein BTH41_01213 [Bacillus mycoides]